MTPPVKLSQDGIRPGNRQYIDEPAVARHYDASLVDNVVAAFDADLLTTELQRLAAQNPHAVVADFGCGTGRSLSLVSKVGLSAIGIDLSPWMLAEAAQKLTTRAAENAMTVPQASALKSPDALSQSAASLSPRSEPSWILVKSNLLELDWLDDASLDLAICFFSTLGMIQGRGNRALFLRSIARVLKPDGKFLVHAHNVWSQRHFPGGKRWLLGNFLQSLWRRDVEFGDRYADNRLVRQLFLHHFTETGLRRELTAAGLSIEACHPIRDELPGTSPLGWIVNCHGFRDHSRK